MQTTGAQPDITAPAQIACLAALGIIGSLAPFILPVIVGGVVDHLGLTLEQAGYVAFADMCGLGLGAFAWSNLITSASWRRFAALAIACVVVGNVFSSLAMTLQPLMASRVLVGIGGGLLLAIGNSGLTMTRSPDRCIGAVNVIAMLCAAIALYCFPLLVKAGGPSAMFLGMAMVTAVVGLAIPGIPRRSPRAAAGGAPASTVRGSLWMPASVCALMGTFLFFFGAINFWIYVERVGSGAGFSTQTIARVLSASHLFGALGAVMPAIVATRLGNRALPLAFCVVLACAMSVLMAMQVSVVTYAIAACAFIFAWDCFYPYLMGLMVTLDPTARLVSFGLLTQTVAKAAGPAAAATVIALFGLPGVYALSAVFFALSLVVLSPAIRESDLKLREATRNSRAARRSADAPGRPAPSSVRQ